MKIDKLSSNSAKSSVYCEFRNHGEQGVMAADDKPERINAAEFPKFLRGALLVWCQSASRFPVPGSRQAVAGRPFFSRSSIAATNVSISSSGV